MIHWLCLLKSRSMAARACQEGRVLLNGGAVRPAREVRAGDRVTLLNPARDSGRVLRILAVPIRQASRKEAPEHYEIESEFKDEWGELR